MRGTESPNHGKGDGQISLSAKEEPLAAELEISERGGIPSRQVKGRA